MIGVINLAGTMDMADNIPNMEKGCGAPVVTQLMGGDVQARKARYAQSSAFSLLPIRVPQALIWGEYEEYVPRPLAQKYVEKATNTGDVARLIIVPGVGHFETASPHTSSWPVVFRTISSMLDKSFSD
jgi:pimeloyl-ACP methyl ester carboxylesterase